MSIRAITTRPAITTILILQLIPLVLLPPSSFGATTQEWWLPMLLLACALAAIAQIILRHSESTGPWDLLSFSHGFNIISRLMLLMPHATVIANGQQVMNTAYVIITLFSILASAAVLWYIGLPTVRTGLFQD